MRQQAPRIQLRLKCLLAFGYVESLNNRMPRIEEAVRKFASTVSIL